MKVMVSCGGLFINAFEKQFVLVYPTKMAGKRLKKRNSRQEKITQEKELKSSISCAKKGGNQLRKSKNFP
jgi:hypothetical protein